jgi:hypothetical protein
MLEQLRSWAKARFGSPRHETPQQSRDNAQVKRETRAHTVTDLQARVRHLQQQITDLTAGDGSSGPEADRQELARLEEELAKTQAELARYQGRI